MAIGYNNWAQIQEQFIFTKETIGQPMQIVSDTHVKYQGGNKVYNYIYIV